MFYSHEILTSRKYGVATIWLVATLGAKSGTKKVTKKAILDVNVKKACETIMEPEAPMALRLQSNLLYGVSKVHDQQWEYLLSDTQAAQNGMRALLKIVRDDGLDPEAGKARPDQLILLDDPAFITEMGLPIFDLSMLDLEHNGDTQRSSQSMLSIRHRSGSVSSSHAASVLGLNIPSSSGGGGSYQLPDFNDPFGGSSAQKNVGLGLNLFDEELMLPGDDDLLFDFDADGELRDIPASEREARRAGSVHPQGRLGSDSAASGRVRKEHEDAIASRGPQIMNADDGDYNMFQYDDVMQMLPDAEPFPAMSGALGDGDQAINRPDDDHAVSEEPSSDSVEAPAKRKKAKPKQKKMTDGTLQMLNGEIVLLQRGYLDRMTAETLIKANNKAKAVAKKNAFHYVFGSGLNDIGDDIGFAKFASPLEMFSGKALLANLTGQHASEVSAQTKRGTKRALEDDEEEFNTPSKRAKEGEVGRGYEDNGLVFNMDHDDGNIHSQEQSLELGRDAPSALADRPSSAMPWNVSASLHSHQRGQSSSIQGRVGILGSQLGSAAGRLTSASPLVGRGTAIPGELGQFSQEMGDDDPMVMYGRDDDDFASGSQAPAFGGCVSSSQIGGLEDFELFGAAAGVDTQTAGQSQWVAQALDRESNNFFDYVKNTISEKMGDELGDEDQLAVQEFGEKSVTFEELFVPEVNSAIVAAQAFYHVLCLATKHRIWVQQTVEDMEPYAEIRIGVL